jgi:hypothetical protein
VTATEIKVGGIFPFSGPASSIGLVGRGILVLRPIHQRPRRHQRAQDQLHRLFDAYSPPKSVEHARSAAYGPGLHVGR